MPENTEQSSTINEQITDSITNLHKLCSDNQGQLDLQPYLNQMLANAVGLAMLNAVNQQQQRYLIQNAVTASIAKSILKSEPDKAIEQSKLLFATDDVSATLNNLKNLLDEVTNHCQNTSPSSESDHPGKEQTAA